MKTEERGREAGSDDEPEALPTTERISDVAAELFRAHGFAATTTREIAKALGIRKSTLYHYIETKEDLLFDICVRALDRISADVRTATERESERRRLEALIAEHIASGMRDRTLHRVQLRDLRALGGERQREVIRRRDEYERFVRGVVADEQTAGRLRADVDVKYLTMALLSLLNWTLYWFHPEGELDPDAVGRLYTDLFVNGAGARAARA